MILISHRGNIECKEVDNENKPEYIIKSISRGFLTEVDVWYEEGDFFLGHDNPQYKINYNFLFNKNLLCHAKNYKALEYFFNSNKIHHYFWHQNDDYTLSSKGIPIIYPGKQVIKGSIIMSWNNTLYTQEDINSCYGVCSDNIIYFNEFIKN